MRNRANTPSRDEAAFINGGTAGIDNTKVTSERPLAVSKAKPVSISFFEENLKETHDVNKAWDKTAEKLGHNSGRIALKNVYVKDN